MSLSEAPKIAKGFEVKELRPKVALRTPQPSLQPPRASPKRGAAGPAWLCRKEFERSVFKGEFQWGGFTRGEV